MQLTLSYLKRCVLAEGIEAARRREVVLLSQSYSSPPLDLRPNSGTANSWRIVNTSMSNHSKLILKLSLLPSSSFFSTPGVSASTNNLFSLSFSSLINFNLLFCKPLPKLYLYNACYQLASFDWAFCFKLRRGGVYQRK